MTKQFRQGIPAGVPRGYRKTVRRALEQGWELRTKSCGWMLMAPKGGSVMLHQTPGRGRAQSNFEAQMKRHGYV